MARFTIHRLSKNGKQPCARVSATVEGSVEEAEALAQRLTDTSQHRAFVVRKAG